MGMKIDKATWIIVWKVLKELKIELPYDPAIPFLDINPETTIQKDICTPVLIEALFTIARTQKQHKCLSTEGWIRCGTCMQCNITQWS